MADKPQFKTAGGIPDIHSKYAEAIAARDALIKKQAEAKAAVKTPDEPVAQTQP